MSRTTIAVAAVGFLAAAGWIFAQQAPAPPGSPAQRPADEAAIREASQALARAFEKGDAKAVAAFWTEEGEYVDEGDKAVRGRAALEKAYADFFANRPELKVESKTDSVRFLSKDTAVEEGTFTVRAKDAPPDSSRYSSMYARQDGQWRIAMLREWNDESADRPGLKDLAWLVGEWESEGEEMKARVTYEWAPGKSFLISRFALVPKKGDAPARLGTQVIGVDPATGLVRAWTFAPDGAIGESSWSWDGRRWSIESEGTLADGSRTTALNFLTPAGADAFTWRSVQQTHDDEDLPDIGPVKVTRVRRGQPQPPATGSGAPQDKGVAR
jgi:uncharacterized protein (TIGR02246 family)